MNTDQNQQDREHVLAELRVARIKAQLFQAHVDHLGILLRDGLIQPWGARAALADLTGTGTGTGNREVSE
jgi:hypothetical protein